MGAHEFIDYRTTDVTDWVKDITDGREIDAILDVVCSDSATENSSYLRFLKNRYYDGRPRFQHMEDKTGEDHPRELNDVI